MWPEKISSAAGIRTECLIETFQSAGHEVWFASAAKNTDFEKHLQDLGVRTSKVILNDSSFDLWVSELRPDAVIFDRFVVEEQFGWRVRSACPEALRIVDSQDLHFLRLSRQKKSPLENEATWRELASFLRSDLSYIISDAETALLKERFNFSDDLIQTLRFYYPDPKPTPNFQSRKNFCTIGNFRHPPNYDAAFVLKQKIWPQIRSQISEAEVHLYGAYPPKEIMDLNDPKSGFIVKGWTEDSLHTLSQYRLNLAPLQFGAGIKGKISDGWYAGTPVITTPMGAEGMSGEMPFGGVVVENQDNFAAAAVTLYQNDEQWLLAHKRGLAIISERFSKTTIQNETLSRFEKQLVHKDELRKKNWMGSILWHQGNRSTEFFGRWLEAKAKLQGGSTV